jgi:hypothetical protein
MKDPRDTTGKKLPPDVAGPRLLGKNLPRKTTAAPKPPDMD